MRNKSKYFTTEAGLLLNELLDAADVSSSEKYKDVFYRLGDQLSIVLNKLLIYSQGSTMLACSSEDADWLAKGLLDHLHTKNLSLAVFWNDRYKFSGSLETSPIIKSYIEKIDDCKTLIIVKSIIATSCVVRTQLSRLIENINPDRIFVVAPVFLKGADKRLKEEFPLNIHKKFRFIYFVVDDEQNEKGEVYPGIGGMIYSNLGFRDMKQKNSYIPEIVKTRLENENK